MGKYKTVNIRSSRMVNEAIEQNGYRLTEREYEFLISRFGLGGEPPYSLQAIGEGYDLTRERVRQVINVALEKIGVDPW